MSEAQNRLNLLEVLYHARKNNPRTPTVHPAQLRKLGEIEFALDMLVELGYVKPVGHTYQITAKGALFFEENDPNKKQCVL